MPKSNPELAKAMGQRLAARRDALGMTQEAVAEAAGITHQQYNRVENGKSCLGADSLRRVASVLQTSTDFLLTGSHGVDRYAETTALLAQMSDRQLRLANQMLRCMLDFGSR